MYNFLFFYYNIYIRIIYLHYEGNEVSKYFCQCNGYFIDWGNNIFEIVICNPSNYLKYLGSKKCLGNGIFS